MLISISQQKAGRRGREEGASRPVRTQYSPVMPHEMIHLIKAPGTISLIRCVITELTKKIGTGGGQYLQ